MPRRDRESTSVIYRKQWSALRPAPELPLPECGRRSPGGLFDDGNPRATVLVFLSSECPCSQSYDRRSARLAQELAPQGVRFVGINANANEPAAEIAAHTRRWDFPFPVLLDRQQVVLRRLGARITPEAYLADAGGTIRYQGRIDNSRNEESVRSHDLRDAVLAVVSGEGPRIAETTPFGRAIVPIDPKPADVSASAVRRRFFETATRNQKETR